jgi:hypothetical protein
LKLCGGSDPDALFGCLPVNKWVGHLGSQEQNRPRVVGLTWKGAPLMNGKSLLSGLLLGFTVLLLSTGTLYPTSVLEKLDIEVDDSQLSQSKILEFYRSLPLSFEANQGQFDTQVKFSSRGHGYSLFLTPREAIMVLRTSQATTVSQDDFFGSGETNSDADNPAVDGLEQAMVRMQLVGGNFTPIISGLDVLPGKVNYLIGNDSSAWQTDVATFSKVEYKDVYPGINLVYYGNQQQLEYDFVVNPGANPSTIALNFVGVDNIEIDEDEAVNLRIGSANVRLQKPIIYQEILGAKKPIMGSYILLENSQVGFQVNAYDLTRPLIIDPVVIYSTFWGGSSGEAAHSVITDLDGNVYITGVTSSPDFPVQNPLKTYENEFGDVFVSKLSADGSSLLYSTYLGGSNEDIAFGIGVDSLNNIFVAGSTESDNFPMQNPTQSTRGGQPDAFVLKLNSLGSAIVYSTYLGGALDDAARAIEVTSDGSAYVTGFTASLDFPVLNAFQDTNRGRVDGFVTKFDSVGVPGFSTYLGGSGDDGATGIAIHDVTGDIYVAGGTESTNFPVSNAYQPIHNGANDIFVSRFNSSFDTIVYSTYVGGAGSEVASDIAIDLEGNAYVAGSESPGPGGFPMVNAFQPTHYGDFEGVVFKLSSSGSSLIYSSYLGGTLGDQVHGIAVNDDQEVYLTGSTQSKADFPVINAFQPESGDASCQAACGGKDAFITRVSADGSHLLSSSYVGGVGADEAWDLTVDPQGDVIMVGQTFAFSSTQNFPTYNAYDPTFGGPIDAFIVKVSPLDSNQPPTVEAGGPYSANEGGTVQLSATGQDPENGPLTYSWDLDNNGIFETSGQSTTFSTTGLNAPSSQVIRVQVTDEGGLTAAGETVVNIIYNFSGFFQPVDNLPTLNVIKAGRGVAARFSLNGNKGLGIFAAGYPISQRIDCDASAPLDNVEETVTVGQGSISYDPTTDQYSYIWKTSTAWAGTCRQFVIQLNDGTDHIAYFKFK